MANTQSFHDWQEADRAAEAAQQAISAQIRAGGRPAQHEVDEVVRRRATASEKLQAMVADMKAKVPARLD